MKQYGYCEVFEVSFVHLHTHSNYSLLDGTIPPEALVEAARRLRFKHLALTDHNGLYGAVTFYRLAREAGIHPIIGSEVSFNNDDRMILLVKNRQGYRNLCQLLSTGHLQGGHLKFKLSIENLIPLKKGLIVLAGGQQGRLWQLVKSREIEAAQQYCRKLKSILGSHFYIEMQIFRQSDLMPNLRLRDLAYEYDIPLVAGNDVHLLKAEDAMLRKVLQAIDRNTLVDRIEGAGYREQYLKSASQMKQLFRQFPDAVRNTTTIARQCTFEFQLGNPVFPRINLPDRETPYSHLWKLAFAGALQRYQVLSKPLTDRLTGELNTINELGFTDYFLIVKDIIEYCARKFIPCIGRGSAGDSLVAYVLGITQVDPLRYNLYFERFLNRERSDPPDIDLDICWKSRDRVIDYVYRKYGKDRTAMLCTFNTFQLRSSIRDVARVFGFPENEIKTITKYLPHYGISRLNEALDDIPECRDIRSNAALLEKVLAYSQRITGFPRHLSIHSGGIVIAPENIHHYTPLEVAAKGIVITQYDMHSMEPLGPVKIDLLGVRALSVISDCLSMLRDACQNLHAGKKSLEIYRFDLLGRRTVRQQAEAYLDSARFPFLNSSDDHLSPLDLRSIPENDANVIALLRQGLSIACFQTESPAMRGLLRKMQIEGMEDVMTAVALIRPGAADSGMKDLYIQRRAGLKPVEYIHPALEKILAETYGGIIYQEQVMQVSAAVAGFSMAQADLLRRAMGKLRSGNPDAISHLRNAFMRGALQNGLASEAAEQVWQFLQNFVGYGFNKAHACTYGMLAYQSAYLKYYFPVQYMTAVLNNEGGFYSRAAYVSECRRLGIQILPPDINQSQHEFTCRNNTIISGLATVHELTRKTAERIIAEQQASAFHDYYDFILRVRPRQGEVENLVKAGALRSIHPNEPLLLLKNKLYFKNKRNRSLTESLTHQVRLEPYQKARRIINELEILGFAASGHPLELFQKALNGRDIVSSAELENYRGQRVNIAGWLVTHRRVMTKNREYMKFMTLEDVHGVYEAVLFSGVYQTYGKQIKSHGPYLMSGIVQSRLPGEANLIVDRVEVLSTDHLQWPGASGPADESYGQQR